VEEVSVYQTDANEHEMYVTLTAEFADLNSRTLLLGDCYIPFILTMKAQGHSVKQVKFQLYAL